MKKTLRDIVSELSAILAGFKLAAIIVTYFGIGSFAKWIIEQWYPFTRWLWENLFVYMNLPEITDVEKDALTAIVFFLPLGLTATLSWIRGRREQKTPAVQVISASLGLLFVYAICGNVIIFVIENTKLEEGLFSDFGTAISDYYLTILLILVGNVLAATTLSIFLTKLIISREILTNYFGRIFDMLYRSMSYRSVVLINRVFMALVGLAMLLNAIFGVVEITSYIPIVAIVSVFVCVVLSVLSTPRKLMVAAGASLAFISTAYVYELLQLVVSFIEGAVPHGVG